MSANPYLRVPAMIRSSGDYLEPLTSKVKRKKFLTFDIESKHGCDYDVKTKKGCPQCEDEGPDQYTDRHGRLQPCEIGQKPGFTRPFLVGIYDREKGRYQEYRDEPHLRSRPWDKRASLPGGCIDKLMTVLLSKKYAGYAIYAHNGGDFDFLHVLAWLRNHLDEFGFEIVPIQTTIQVLRVWRLPDAPDKPVKEVWEFLDSVKLFPMTLQKACESFGVEGKLEDHDLARHEDDESWTPYLKQDNVGLAEVLNRFYDMVEDWGGEVGITTPSTSMRLFRRRFLGRGAVQEKVPRYRHFPDCKSPETCEGCLHAFVRLGYYGGRTEIHAFFGELLKYADVNSSYVAAMLRDMPIGDMFVEKGKLDWRRHETGKWTGFCECSVYVPPSCTIPPLPHRHKITKKLVFPAGEFNGVWSTEELALLTDPLVGGEIRHVVKTVWYGLRPMFGDMVRELWRYRDKNAVDAAGNKTWDAGLDALAKLLGNALYGKFAMRPERSMVVFVRDVDVEHCFLCGEEMDPRTGPSGAKHRDDFCDACVGSKPAANDLDSDVWYQAKRTDAAYIIPQVSAYITAIARVTLWKKMREVIANGGKIFYCDSVTEDRTTVVRGPRGIEVLTFAELWERGGPVSHDRAKEFRSPNDYETLSRARGEAEGSWRPVRCILRHLTDKPTHRVSTKHGQTQVTSDHGILLASGEAVTPEAFVAAKHRFERVTMPRVPASDRVDLFEHVKHFAHERHLQKPERVETYRFVADEDWITMPSFFQEQRSAIPIRIRRFYEKGSKELASLLRLVGAYASDGSASLVGWTTESRFMLSFCKADLELQTRLAEDLKTIAPDVTVTGPLWSDTVYVVRSGTVAMACLFAALGGVGCKEKHLPSFCHALGDADLRILMKALEDGDGSIDVAGQFVFTTTSAKLAGGLSLLLHRLDREHAWAFRPSKVAWTLRTRPNGSERNRMAVQHERFESTERYVYDLTVPGSESFVDGIGQVLLHNTDSIISDYAIATSTELGEMKDEYPGEFLSFTAVQPKVYMIERTTANEALRRQILALEEAGDAEEAGKVKVHEAKVTMKGFPKRLRTKENLAVLRAGDGKTTGKIIIDRLEKVRSLARAGFKRGPRMVRIAKGFKSTYDKRVVSANGNDTTPIVLHEPIGGVLEDIDEAAE